jgi:hypothetical protein
MIERDAHLLAACGDDAQAERGREGDERVQRGRVERREDPDKRAARGGGSAMTSEVTSKRLGRYGAAMRAGRLHTALVYFGLRDDPALADRLNAGPVTAWRVALGAVAVVVGLAVAFGILALLGAPPPWSDPVAALVVAVAVSTVFRRWRRGG